MDGGAKEIVPSSQRRGGCAIKKKSRSLRSGADGVARPASLRLAELLLRLRAFLEAARYHACASRGLALRATPARQLLQSCRATPPLRGGEFTRSILLCLTLALAILPSTLPAAEVAEDRGAMGLS